MDAIMRISFFDCFMIKIWTSFATGQFKIWFCTVTSINIIIIGQEKVISFSSDVSYTGTGSSMVPKSINPTEDTLTMQLAKKPFRITLKRSRRYINRLWHLVPFSLNVYRSKKHVFFLHSIHYREKKIMVFSVAYFLISCHLFPVLGWINRYKWFGLLFHLWEEVKNNIDIKWFFFKNKNWTFFDDLTRSCWSLCNATDAHTQSNSKYAYSISSLPFFFLVLGHLAKNSY